MKPKQRHLMLEQLEATLEPLASLRTVRRPVRGWLRAIRDAVGMSGRQFAVRLGVSSEWISKLEKNELHGTVTLKTMQRAAEALDCEFVYAIVPRDSLSGMVRHRAEQVARQRMAGVAHTMLLEGQQLEATEQHKALAREIEELIREIPRELWDAPE
ncbi:MAG: DNA-binding protein [Desulfobulbaceae bacterium A2]|nr:MAG: DNA-binding protein [Desulfobulbaceae bacterium A2]